jgi:hypothetical protein
VHWRCSYATALNIEVDAQRRRFGRRESDCALQTLIEDRAAKPERVQVILLRWHSSGIEVRLGLPVGLSLPAEPASSMPRWMARGKGGLHASLPREALEKKESISHGRGAWQIFNRRVRALSQLKQAKIMFTGCCLGSVCVYYCSTYYKVVRVGGGGWWRTCATRYDEPRPVRTSLPITH